MGGSAGANDLQRLRAEAVAGTSRAHGIWIDLPQAVSLIWCILTNKPSAISSRTGCAQRLPVICRACLR